MWNLGKLQAFSIGSPSPHAPRSFSTIDRRLFELGFAVEGDRDHLEDSVRG
jgi:hypothetical protein